MIHKTLHVYYHVACMGELWPGFVMEQLALLAHMRIEKVHSFVLGSHVHAERIKQIGQGYGIEVDVLGTSPMLQLYETPTLECLWTKARECSVDDTFLYLHTKGVSQPWVYQKKKWRRMMQQNVIGRLPENIQLLNDYDTVGANFSHWSVWPLYAGTFWMARGDWIRGLANPMIHRGWQCEAPWGECWDRMHSELWVLHKKNARHYDYQDEPTTIWNDEIHEYPIKGFDYTPYDKEIY